MSKNKQNTQAEKSGKMKRKDFEQELAKLQAREALTQSQFVMIQ